MTPAPLLESIRDRIRGKGARVVLPEGDDPRALRAAAMLRDGALARPILLGSADAVRRRAAESGVDLADVALRDPASDPEAGAFAAAYLAMRKHKGISSSRAAATVRLPHYFGAWLVKSGAADGMVSGLRGDTKPFLPAFEVVGLRDGAKRASSVFLMTWPDRVLFYADCSVNIAPDAATLAEIGLQTAATARAFGVAPRVAFLSFSTRDSAKSPSIDRVKAAVAIARAAEPSLEIDGELQFDAAFVPDVAAHKCPDSPLRGGANVFVFPDIDAGNIAYKITERLAGAAAIGPILQGLRHPVNDVSRACTAQDLFDVAAITAAQALARSANGRG